MKDYDLMRPADIYDTILKQRKTDGIEFNKKYHKEFIDTKCPVCAKDGNHMFEKYGFSHKQCRECQTIYCSPRPTPELLNIYYNAYAAPKMWTELLVSTDMERKAIQYEPRIRILIQSIKEHNPAAATALDLGAGSGAFTLSLSKLWTGKDVIALDISEDCIQKCKSLGLKTHLGPIETVTSDSIDVIFMNDLIEHVFDPFLLLKECKRVLRPNGLVYIATPNGEGFDFKIMKGSTVNITPPEHLQYFNPVSLVKLLQRVGITPVLVQTPGKLDVEIVKKSMDNGLKINDDFIKFLLTRNQKTLDDFQTFLANNNLSSHMLIGGQRSE